MAARWRGPQILPMSTVQEQRAAVIAEARSFLDSKTKFQPNQCLKGVAVACGPLLRACYKAAGIAVPEVIPDLPLDWAMHKCDLTRSEAYLSIVESFSHRVESPLPGDVAMFRLGWAFSHSGIIIEAGWPQIIESRWGGGVQLTNALLDPVLSRAKVLFLSPWT